MEEVTCMAWKPRMAQNQLNFGKQSAAAKVPCSQLPTRGARRYCAEAFHPRTQPCVLTYVSQNPSAPQQRTRGFYSTSPIHCGIGPSVKVRKIQIWSPKDAPLASHVGLCRCAGRGQADHFAPESCRGQCSTRIDHLPVTILCRLLL